MAGRPIAAALRLGKKIISTYGLHDACWELAEREGHCPRIADTAEWRHFMEVEIKRDLQLGFIDVDGRFMSREEAFEWHEANGDFQDYEPHEKGLLHAPDVYALQT